MPKIDNRMGWIRNLEKIREGKTEPYYAEYELLSECHIPGVLSYKDESFLCGGMTYDSDPKHYLLKIKFMTFPTFEPGKATTDGYYFEGGIAGEMVSLMSLFLQCRFYQIAYYQGDLTPHGLRTKFEFPSSYKKCNPALHPTIFDKEDRTRSFTELPAFLDQVESLDPEYHHSFALACRQYAMALRSVGVDEEMVFIRLVSAIEALSKHTKLTPEEDPFAGKTLDELVVKEYNRPQELDAMRNIFQTRKTALRFKKFIKTHMGNILPDAPPMENTGYKWITTENLDKILGRIYTARSKYLHEGQTMYLSQHLRESVGDFDPSLGLIIDNREFTEDEQLPLTSPFENLVRQCLINFVAANQA